MKKDPSLVSASVFFCWQRMKHLPLLLLLHCCHGDNETPRARREHAVALVNGSVFIFGGLSNDGDLLNDLFAYDGIWRRVGEHSVMKPSPRRLAGAAAANGQFYVFGGLDAGGVRSDVFVFDGYGWTSPATTGDFPAARMAAAVAAYENLVFVFGGVDYVGRSRNDLSILNTTTGVWSSARTSEEGPSPRSHSPFAAPNSAGEATFYLHGGRSGDLILRDTWAFDFRTSKWSLLSGDGPARAQHSLIFTSSLGEEGREESQVNEKSLLLLGGVDERRDRVSVGDQFELTVLTHHPLEWRNIIPLVPTKSEHSLDSSTFTPLSDNLILQFGGVSSTPGNVVVVHKCCLESGAVYAIS